MTPGKSARLAALAAFLTPASLLAADIVIAPPATGGVSITNAAGSTTRLRVGDDGVVTFPGLGSVPVPASGLCVEVATGRLGTCAMGGTGTVTSILAGAGLTGGLITTSGSIALAASQLLPTAPCSIGQVPKWVGTNWICAVDATGGGTVTGVTASAPLASSGGATPNLSLTGGVPGEVLAGTAGAPAWTGSPSFSGNLELVASTASAGNILKNGSLYIHSIGGDYTFYAGTGAGAAAVSATGTTAVGGYTLSKHASGGSNTAIGAAALVNTTNGSFNVVVGTGAATGDTIGDFNTIVGTNSFSSTTTAFQNTGVGGGVLENVSSGNGNTALGYGAGSNITTGNSNIAIGNSGNAADSGVIRIGNFLQSKAFMAGIREVTTDLADAIPVVISSNGQLGTASSSRRVKQDIADMGEASDVLMDLRPVTFRYRSQAVAGQGALQYGLVAEEVAEVAPSLAVRSSDGRIETVNYPALVPMLLNELQKQQRVIESQALRLERLEAALGIR